MAIIIPSKNIYDKNNNIVLKNQINKVEVNAITPVSSQDYNIMVYNEDITPDGSINIISQDLHADYKQRYIEPNLDYPNGQYVYSEVLVYTGISGIKEKEAFINVDIKIPQLQNNTYINKIYNETNNDGNPNIKYTVYITKTIVPIKVKVNVSSTDGTFYYPNDNTISFGEIEYLMDDIQSENITISNNDDLNKYLKITKTVTANATSQTIDMSTATSTSAFTNQDNTKIIQVTSNTEEETWDITGLKIFNGIDFYEASYKEANIGDVLILPKNSTRILNGTWTAYRPTKITLTIYGDEITLDISNNKVIEIGNKNNKNVFSVENNELIQSSNYYQENSTKVNLIEKLGNNILLNYEKGLQTATILCSISDYYDESGEKVITKDGTENIIFRMHDEVIPYVYNANGVDIPMSLNQDGTPKIFRVIGTNIYYDGAVWQELTLKEKIST